MEQAGGARVPLFEGAGFGPLELGFCLDTGTVIVETIADKDCPSCCEGDARKPAHAKAPCSLGSQEHLPNGSTQATEQVAGAGDETADGNTCAICLEQIHATDLSIVKDCEHVYCVYCILQWAAMKDTPWCPQCKSPFSYLYCYRQLDGTLTDYAIEESVTLLKRAKWFEERVKAEEKGKDSYEEDISTATAGTPDWYHEFYEDFDDGNEDEEIEDFYFSRAAGHARIVIANRRWGEGGYMRSGRMYATPTSGNSSNGNSSHGNAKSKGHGKSGKAQLGHVYGSSPPTSRMLGGSPCARDCGPSPSGSGSASKPGRRAKRNAKRVAADGDA